MEWETRGMADFGHKGFSIIGGTPMHADATFFCNGNRIVELEEIPRGARLGGAARPTSGFLLPPFLLSPAGGDGRQPQS